LTDDPGVEDNSLFSIAANFPPPSATESRCF
jgi:hypothetical protein